MNIRSGPNWASIGSAHEVLVGVRHNSTLCLAAQALMSAFLPGIKRENYRFSSFYTVLRNQELMPAVQDLEKFKSPIGVTEHDFAKQFALLDAYTDKLRKQD